MDQVRMKLSVILPCYNGAATIAVQLEALTRQQWQGEWEVVVVNNGSTDNSMEIVESYRDRLPQLRIVEAYHAPGPRQGVTHSYTVGFQAAMGDAFVLCEADDEVGDGWLTSMGKALQTYDFVAAALEYQRLNPAWLVGDGWQQQSVEAGLTTISPPLFLPYASGCSFGLQRSVYETIGFPDKTCGASWDTDYCWRAHLAGIPLHFVPEATIHYRLRHQLGDRYRQGKSWGKAHLALYRKYGPPPTRLKALKHYLRSTLQLSHHLLQLPISIRDRQKRANWVWGLGWCVGNWQGGEHLWT